MNYNILINERRISMKKIKSLLLLAVACLMVCCCFMFTGCNITTTSKIYKFNAFRFTEEDRTVTIEVNTQYQDIELKEDSCLLILYPNNTFALRFNIDGIDEPIRNDNTSSYYNTPEYFLYSMQNTAIVGKWIEGYNNEIYLCSDVGGQAFIVKKGPDSLVIQYSKTIQMRFIK